MARRSAKSKATRADSIEHEWKPKRGHVCGSADTAVEAESTGPTCESTEQAEMPVEKPAEKPEKRVQKKRKRATSEGRRTRSKA